jgi:Holliday junction resolvase RusA-like endonuclease
VLDLLTRGEAAMSGAIGIDLPSPPSVNKITGRKVYRSKTYLDWMAAADTMVMANRQYPKRKIVTEFCAHLVLDHSVRGDIDNHVKVVLDWAQSRDVIKNDRDCQRLVVERGEAPAGCRLTLREWRV